MTKIDERIIKANENIRQLKNQKRAQEKRMLEQRNKIDTRRKILIGEFVLKYFPEVIKFQPCRSNKDNEIEFAPLINFLMILADDKNYVNQIKDISK